LEAFKVNSIDYLSKPIEAAQLSRAIGKLLRIRLGTETPGNVDALLKQVRSMLEQHEPEYLSRVASRKGGRVEFIDVGIVTHFCAEDKLTFAVIETKEYALDMSVSELEQRLSPKQWIRIHRSMLLNIDAVKELRSWFGGKLLLKDEKTDISTVGAQPNIVGTLPKDIGKVTKSTGPNSSVNYFSGYTQITDPSFEIPTSSAFNGLSAGYSNKAIVDPNGNVVLVNPQPGEIGTLGYSTIKGPAALQFDMNILKRFKIMETREFEFRLDAINVSNRPNFGIR
jgi:hypothetical protein